MMEIVKNANELTISSAFLISIILSIIQIAKNFKGNKGNSTNFLPILGFIFIQAIVLVQNINNYSFYFSIICSLSIFTNILFIASALIQTRKVTSQHLFDSKNDETRLKTLENIIAEMPGHVFWKNKHGIFLGCNNQQAKTLGLASWQEVIGKTTYDMVWHDQPEEERRKQALVIDKNDRMIMETGISQVLEEPLILPDGSEAIYLSKKTPLRDASGEVIGILGVSFDITELKQTQKELQESQHKLEGMTLVGASIAHELRTPLAAIKISNENLKNVFSILIEAYRLAQKANIPIPTIREYYLKVTETAYDVISSEVKSSNNFIDMLLMNVNTAINNNLPQTGQFLISNCINKALSRYPFKEHQQKLICINLGVDFLVKGNQELIEHVLFNLIKNALYSIAAASKDNAHIKIWLEKSTVFNKLYFEDTGTGIDSDILPHIFERFFSRTHHGAGIGLTFCRMVMESLGGSIACESEKGNYTQFILLFPSINT